MHAKLSALEKMVRGGSPRPMITHVCFIYLFIFLHLSQRTG